MNYTSIGDLALTFQNRRRNVEIRSDLARLSEELASGQKSDISTAVAGDFSPIVGLERDLKANLAYATSANEARMFASAQQSSLELIQRISDELGPSLLSAGSSESALIIETTTSDARHKFESVLAAFNTQVANRYAFSGTATDQRALADVDTILTALLGATASETTAAGVESIVEAWFDDVGGGFESIGYTGSDNELSPFRLSESETASLALKASDQRVRDILIGFALAALVGEGVLGTDTSQRAALTSAAGENVLGAQYSLAELRGAVGSGEAKIENATAQNAAQKAALEIARSDITAVDPYRVATELEAVKLQLETLYTLTVRLSRLSLAEYLR